MAPQPLAVIYGNSQSGGTGLDLAKVLKATGVAVKRVTRNGANDAKLLANVSDLGDPAQYAHAFLYVGGNNDAPSVAAIAAMVEHFNGRASVILPPVNVGRASAKVATHRAKNAANAEGLAAAGIARVYAIEAPFSDFTTNTDHVHLRAGSAPSLALARDVVADAHAYLADPNGPRVVQVGGSPAVLAMVGGGLAAWLLLRRQR